MDNIVATRIESSSPVVDETRVPAPLPIGEPGSTPPSLRVEANQLPLVVDLLGAKPYYDTFNVKELSEQLDTYLNNELKRQSLGDQESAYQRLVEETVKKLHLSEDATVWTKLEKLTEYFTINQKMLDAMDERDRLLTADPMDLTSTQLKKRWELTHG